jgi:hypothetical protein
MTNEQNNKPLERIEEIVNWTLPGMTMYYRDTNLTQEIIAKYEVRKIFRSKTFVDVSNFAGKPTTNCRFIFASSKAAPLFRINPATEKWGLHSINCNSYFKVLDVYKKEGVTQIFLIHIPYKGIDFFRRTVLKLGEQNIEEQIIGKAKESLNQKLQSDIPAALSEKEWIDRTNFPIGLDNKNEFFSLEPEEQLMPMAVPMFSAIKKMTNDLTDLNETPIPAKKVSTPNTVVNKPKEKPKKKGGFWSNLFGKN